MRKILTIVLSVMLTCVSFAQDKSLLDYDVCKEDISNALIKKYDKAFNYFKERKYNQASSLLQDIIKENEDFASAYFLLGLIGVRRDNATMIMKYFPLVREHCSEFSHPYLYYYMGMIEYTNEHYEKAAKEFERFLSVTDKNNFYDSLQNIAINYIDWSDFLATAMENPVPFNPNKVNFLAKNKNYYEPFITWDGNEIWFIREEVKKDTNRDSFLADVSTSVNRYMQKSVLDSSGFYDKGFIEDAPFNIAQREGGVSVTADNNYLFFSAKGREKGNDPTWNIYYCEKFDGYWSDAKQVNINTETFDEFSPSVSADGNYLYFVSNRQGGKGGYDIWVSKRTGKNSWGEPQNLGRNVNTFADESYPFIAADNTHLYFLSNGRKTIGGTDIFVYDIRKEKPAVNIGYPINTEANERNMGVMADGKTAYSVFKNTDNKFHEINLFTLPTDKQAEERIFLKAKVHKDIDGDISVRLTTLPDGTTTSYYVATEHPEITLVIDADKTYQLSIDQNGYMFYSKKINARTKDLIIEQTPVESGASMHLYDIKFENGTKNFDDYSTALLDSFVDFLKTHQRLRFTLSADKNMLSALKTYLIKSGIRQDRISVKEISSSEIIYTVN